MEEIQGYFAGQVTFKDLSEMAKLFVTCLYVDELIEQSRLT